MNKLFFLLFILFACSGCVNAQKSSGICVRVDCKDTIRYPQDTVTLNSVITSPDGLKLPKWRVIWGAANPVTIDNSASASTVARGLSKGGSLFVFSLTDTSVNGAIGVAYDSVVYIHPSLVKTVTVISKYWSDGTITTTTTTVP